MKVEDNTMVAPITNTASTKIAPNDAPQTKSLAEVKAELQAGLGIVDWDALKTVLSKYDLTDGKEYSISRADIARMLADYDSDKNGRVSKDDLKPILKEVVAWAVRGVATKKMFGDKQELGVEDIVSLLEQVRGDMKDNLNMDLAF